ncbi:MAG: hypothetical protein AAF674_07300 [Pseudomonadota bacterium]
MAERSNAAVGPPIDPSPAWVARWAGPLALLVLVAALIAAFLIKADTLLTGFDGGYMRDLARRQMAWGLPPGVFGPDHMMGLGDLGFTTNFQLFPAFLAGSPFGTSDLAKAVTYTIVFLEISGAVYLLGRRLALGPVAAWLAALSLPLLALPLFEAGALYPIYALVPQMMTTVAVTTLMGWAFVGIGRQGLVLPLVVFFAGLLHLIFSAIVVVILALPVMLLYAVAGLVTAAGARERWLKAGALAMGIGIMLAGPVWFLLGLAMNTAPSFFAAELCSDRASLLFSTILFHGNLFTLAGPGLAGLAIAGAILTLVQRDAGSPARRALALGLLIFIILLIALWAMTMLSNWWAGPSPLYFEFYAAPLYAIFAAHMLAWIAHQTRARGWPWIAQRLVRLPERWQIDHPSMPRVLHLILNRAVAIAPRTGVTLGAAALALGFAAFTKTPANTFPYPPAQTSLTQALAADLALNPDAEFRGRVATLTGQTLADPVRWVDLHYHDLALGGAFGNPHRLVGLTHFGIPTLFPYTSSLSPGIYAIASRLLALPGDRQTRSTLTMRRYNPRILAMLGVAAVIIDAPLAGVSQIASPTNNDVALFAYQVPEPNRGNYAPARIASGQDAATILAAMAANDFDPRAVAYVDLPADLPGITSQTPLAPLLSARLRVTRKGWHVTADSPGRALLLLPVEFSACLSATATSGAPRLVRTNLVLTGVLFEGRLDMKLTHRHGPLTNPFCRLQDRAAFKSLGLDTLPAPEWVGRVTEE